jgi:signal transduction histidine kinase
VIVGDPIRLHQIVLNLVSNAVKFTSKGKITVSAKLATKKTAIKTLTFVTVAKMNP